MELFNDVAKQQSTQVQAAQKTTQAKVETTQEVKPQIDKTVKNEPITSEVEARDLVDSLNKALDPFNTSLRFGFDNSDNVFFVSVIDAITSDVIRRFPLEQAATLTAKMNEVTGIIFDEKG